ncbi:MAG: hypothetical protein JSW58_04930 [Candidatus Latescibacterota bacterium]|nr:MAG: hypothetical protein JSW58_04930 [Candidatus Latescibacterota bacterium]
MCQETGHPGHGDPSVTKDVPGPDIAHAAIVAKINITDDRADVMPDGRRLHMPEWTIVGQEDRIAPALGNRERDHIRREVEKHFVPGATRVTVDVFVLDGTQTYKVGERVERVTATFSLRIEIANHADIHDVRIGVGTALCNEESLDFTPDKVDEIYFRTISESIHRAFEQIASNSTHH